MTLFDSRTNGAKKKSDEESEAEMLEEFILNAEIQKLQKINALNTEMQKKQNEFIAELNSIDIPELHRFRDGDADPEMADSADIVEEAVSEDEETEDEDDDNERKEGTVDHDGDEVIRENDGKEIKKENEMQIVREEMEKTVNTTTSAESDAKVIVDGTEDDDDDVAMKEIGQKTGFQRMEERNLSDSELQDSNKDVGNLLIPRNRAHSQRVFAGIHDLPQLSPSPFGLSQMSLTPMSQSMNEEGKVNEQRKAT